MKKKVCRGEKAGGVVKESSRIIGSDKEVE